MGNVLIISIDFYGTVPNSQTVTEIAHSDVELDRLFFGLFISDLQMVISGFSCTLLSNSALVISLLKSGNCVS